MPEPYPRPARQPRQHPCQSPWSAWTAGARPPWITFCIIMITF